jgi:hypothetical protein
MAGGASASASPIPFKRSALVQNTPVWANNIPFRGIDFSWGIPLSDRTYAPLRPRREVMSASGDDCLTVDPGARVRSLFSSDKIKLLKK